MISAPMKPNKVNNTLLNYMNIMPPHILMMQFNWSLKYSVFADYYYKSIFRQFGDMVKYLGKNASHSPWWQYSPRFLFESITRPFWLLNPQRSFLLLPENWPQSHLELFRGALKFPNWINVNIFIHSLLKCGDARYFNLIKPD